jgi:hypothetical protein
MRIQVHIDRLVLDGLPVQNQDGSAIQEAIERELTRLLAEGGLSPDLASGGAFTNIRAETIKITENSPPKIGRKIAHAVYGGIGQ